MEKVARECISTPEIRRPSCATQNYERTPAPQHVTDGSAALLSRPSTATAIPDNSSRSEAARPAPGRGVRAYALRFKFPLINCKANNKSNNQQQVTNLPDWISGRKHATECKQERGGESPPNATALCHPRRPCCRGTALGTAT
ncbi:hypothetical protein ACHAWF_000365 [Thalassiosira exigua]